MNVKYIEFKDKHPKDKKEDRVYFDEPNPDWRSYGCSYSGEFLKLDIDDYDHATEQLEEPIKGKPRSEAVIELLNALNVRYNGIRTEHGVHLFFRVPSGMETKTKQNWYSVIGVKCEWKFPQSDDHIPLKIGALNGSFSRVLLTTRILTNCLIFSIHCKREKKNLSTLLFRAAKEHRL